MTHTLENRQAIIEQLDILIQLESGEPREHLLHLGGLATTAGLVTGATGLLLHRYFENKKPSGKFTKAMSGLSKGVTVAGAVLLIAGLGRLSLGSNLPEGQYWDAETKTL